MPIAARTEEIFSPGFKYFLLIWIPGYILMAGLVLSMGYEQSFLWLNSFRIPGADLPMQILSWMGNGGTAGFICWLALRKKESSVLIFCLLSLLLTGLISQLLKHQVFPEWHRPLQVFEGREQIHFFTHQSFRFNSFPSGHSTTAGAMGIILALCWCRTFFQAAGLAIFTLLIGFSRVYIGVHFPGDVIAGWLLGSVVSLLLFVFLKPRLSIRSEKAEKILQIVMTVLAIVLLAWDIYKFPLL